MTWSQQRAAPPFAQADVDEEALRRTWEHLARVIAIPPDLLRPDDSLKELAVALKRRVRLWDHADLDELAYWIDAAVRDEAPAAPGFKTLGDVALFVTRYGRADPRLRSRR